MRQRGMTLVEVVITLAILALATGVMVPGLRNLTRADLRRGARGLSGLVRQSFDEAALTGQTVRLVLTAGKGKVEIETTEAALSFDSQSGAFVAAAKLADVMGADAGTDGDANDRRGGSAVGGAGDSSGGETAAGDQGGGRGALAALVGINTLAKKNIAAGFHHERSWSLPGEVQVLSLWTDGAVAATSEGQIYLHFFPGGYTQEALVHLQDGDKRIFTVKVHGLTGRTEILDHYVEVQR